MVTVSLPLGKYHVKEKRTLYGYVLPDKGWDVEFTWDNKDEEYVLNVTDAGVFVLHAGVAGVAVPSLIARAFSAVVVTVLCFRKENGVYYRKQWIFQFNAGLLKRILGIAVPNGVE